MNFQRIMSSEKKKKANIKRLHIAHYGLTYVPFKVNMVKS